MNLEHFVHFALENMSHCFYSQHINLRKNIYLYKNWYDLYHSLIPPYVSILCFSYEKIIIIFRVIAFLNVTSIHDWVLLESKRIWTWTFWAMHEWLNIFVYYRQNTFCIRIWVRAIGAWRRNAIVLTLNIPKGL